MYLLVPIGTYCVPIGTYCVPIGTYWYLLCTYCVPIGTYCVPFVYLLVRPKHQQKIQTTSSHTKDKKR